MCQQQQQQGHMLVVKAAAEARCQLSLCTNMQYGIVVDVNSVKSKRHLVLVLCIYRHIEQRCVVLTSSVCPL